MLAKFHEEIKALPPSFLTEYADLLELNQKDDKTKLAWATKLVLEEMFRIWMILRQGFKDSYPDKSKFEDDVDKFKDEILWVGQFDLFIEAFKSEVGGRRPNK